MGSPKPLRILTIDGGGLQGVSTLLILGKVLEDIGKARNPENPKKPRPCDVFDVIAGIGAGGWLANLLGRFRMDITSCLTEWYKIVDRTTSSKLKELPRRMLQRCYVDTKRLVKQVEDLTKLYDRGEFLFEPNPEQARTRHVIVAASRSDTKGYNIFRSYEVPNTAKSPELLLEGPANPGQFKISSAFGVTGASNYFTHEWEEQMESSGKVKFKDAESPKPHNITGLALDEMWAIYSPDVPLSVVVSIGPGLPNSIDVKQITTRLSWGPDIIADYRAMSIEASTTRYEKSSNKTSASIAPPDVVKQDDNSILSRLPDNATSQNLASTPVLCTEKRDSISQKNKTGSIKGGFLDAELRQRENGIEQAIKSKLDEFYPSGSGLYYRLAPAYTVQGTVKSDSGGEFSEVIEGFLKEPGTRSSLEEVVKRLK